MSKTIDEKVVEMRFDNQDFERNVNSSINTLQRLKDNLNFSGIANGFDSISKAASNVDFSGFTVAIDTVTDGFNAMEAVAFSVLQRITNEAITMGTQLASSLSIDQISAGFDKYAQKTEAVQTIMAATNMSAEDVTDKIEKLAWFSDETSYNFVDMVSNVGKFTSAGKSLEDSITAIMGVANWAAVSGQNAETASRAMYQLAQAMGKGVVNGQDWSSIETANMATMEFKKNVIETAEEMGKLVKYGDNLWAASNPDSWSADKKTGELKEKWITAENFGFLGEEKWFTSDVLLETLRKYGVYSDAIYEISGAYETCAEAMEAFDSQTDISGDKAMQLSQKAFKAGQVSKTFSDAINAVKDSVSSGWMKTFEIIFGNFDEATALWTEVNDAVFRIFGESQYARNEMLAEWKDEGRDPLLNGVTQIYETFMSIGESIRTAFEKIFPPMTADRLVEITKRFEEVATNIRNFVTEVHDFGDPIWQGLIDFLNEPIKETSNAYEELYKLTGKKPAAWGFFSQIGEGIDIWKDAVTDVDRLLTYTKSTLTDTDVVDVDAVAGVVEAWSDKTIDILALCGETVSDMHDASTDIANGISGSIEEVDAVADIVEAFGYSTQDILELCGADLSNMGTITDEIAEEFQDIRQDMGDSIYEWSDLIDQMAMDVIKGNWGNDPFRQEELEAAGYNYHAIQNRVNEIVYGFEEWHSYIGDLEEATAAYNAQVNGIVDSVEDVAEAFEEVGEEVEEALPDTVLTRLQRTFQGLFAVVDIVGEAFRAVGRAIEPVTGSLPEIIWHVTGLTAAFGDFFVRLRDTIKENNVFGNAINKVLGFLSEAFWRAIGHFETLEEKEAFLKNARDTIVKYFTAIRDWATTVGGIIRDHVERLLGIKDVTDEAERSTILWDKYSAVMEGVRKILGGVVSAFQLLGGGIQVVFSIIQHPIAWISSAVGKLTGLLFGLATSAGEAITNLKNSAKESGFFEGILQNVAGVFGGAPTALGTVVTNLQKIVTEKIFPKIVDYLGNVATTMSNLFNRIMHPDEAEDDGTTFLEKVVTKLQAAGGTAASVLKWIINAITTTITGLWNGLNTAVPSIGKWLLSLGDSIVNLITRILDSLGTGTGADVAVETFFSGLLGWLSGSALSGILTNLKKFTTITGDAFVTLKDTLQSAKWWIEEQWDQVRAIGNKIQAYVAVHFVQELAKAILLIAAAVLVLSFVDADRLEDSLHATMTIVFMLATVAAALIHINMPPPASMLSFGAFAIGFAAGVTILTGALKNIAKIKAENLGDCVAAVISLVVMLGFALGNLDTSSMDGTAMAIIAFSAAIWVLAKAVGAMYDVFKNVTDVGSGIQVAVSLAAVVGMVVLLAKMLGSMDTAKLSISGLTLLGFAAAIYILISALKNLMEAVEDSEGNIDGDKVAGMIFAVIALASLMWQLANVLSNIPEKKAMLIGLTIKTIASTIASLSETVLLLGDAFGDPKKMGGTLSGLISVFALLVILQASLVAMDQLTNNPMEGGGALLSMAAAIFVIAGALSILSSIPIPGLIAGFVSLAVTLTALGVAAFLLQGLAGPITALSTAFLIFGAACLVTGVGLQAIAVGILALGGAIAGIVVIGTAITAIQDLIVAVLGAIGLGLVALAGNILDGLGELIAKLCQVIIDSAPVIASAVLAFLLSFFGIISAKQAVIFGLIGVLVFNLLKYLLGLVPEFLKMGATWVAGVFTGAVEGIKQWASDFIKKFTYPFVQGWEDLKKLFGIHSPSTVFAGFAENCLLGFSVGAESNAGLVSGSLLDVFGNAFSGLGSFVGDLFGFGQKTDTQIANGVNSNSSVVTGSYTGLMDDSLGGLYSYSDDFFSVGDYDISSLVSGFDSSGWMLSSTMGSTTQGAINTGYGYYDSFVTLGNAMGEGYMEGLREMADAVRETAGAAIGGNSLAGIGKIIEYNSPSHAAERMGHGLGEGYILGMEAISGEVYASSVSLGGSSLDGLKGAIARAGDISSDDLTFSPTIRPVLDMSNVMAGRANIENLLAGARRSIDIAGDASARIEANQIASVDGIHVDNKNVVEAITAMRGDISVLSDAVRSMQIVMDTGSLVGAIAAPMDTALGRRAVYAGRGI